MIKLTERRFEAAHDPLNAEHWRDASEDHINVEIDADLQTLMTRCSHEYKTNPIVEGVVGTHSIDLLGESGPTLQVISDSPRYNSLVEEIWEGFWNSCTVRGVAGVDLLARWNKNDWIFGNSLAQFVDFSKKLPSNEIIKTRLLDIHPKRLANPWRSTLEKDVFNGIEVDEFNLPVRYHIKKKRNRHSYFDNEPKPFPAKDFLHWFQSRDPEADQVCGYPRLASPLPDTAETAEYEKQVMDAARAAADSSAVLTTQPSALPFLKHAKPLPTGATLSSPRRSLKAAPIGYDFNQMDPKQPIAKYKEYIHERYRRIGRPVHMPLLSILLDANDANFSQSRIALNILYERGLNNLRGKIQRYVLLPLVMMIVREASLATFNRSGSRRLVLGRRPKNVKFIFGWEPLGHANPKDYAQAVERLLAMRLTSPQRELSKSGTTVQEILNDWKEYEAETINAGLNPLTLQPFGSPPKDEKESSNESA